MRRGTNDIMTLTNEAGQFLGISLGWDFCSEHEWGIKKLNQAFGINPEGTPGLGRRRITKCPTLLFGAMGAKVAGPKAGKTVEAPVVVLGYDDYNIGDQAISELKRVYFNDYRDERRPEPNKENLATLWSEGDFMIIAKSVLENEMRELHTALTSLNAVIMLGGRASPFGGSGLMILIRDRIDKSVVDMWTAHDKGQDTLKRVVERSGIEKKLKAAGCTSYALSPRWVKDAPENMSKRSMAHIQFWLNPCDQVNVEAGWYTQADLEAWMKGTGPCLKASRK